MLKSFYSFATWCSSVSYVQITNMTIMHNGGNSLEVSGYNNTVTGVTVMGNGCGGVALSGGDQVIIHSKPALLSHQQLHSLDGASMDYWVTT